jgi:hypothetical protein
MSRPPEGQAPLVRSSEVVRDVAAVVDWIRGRSGGTHFAHLDRSERGRAAFVSAILAFLAGRPAP